MTKCNLVTLTQVTLYSDNFMNLSTYIALSVLNNWWKFQSGISNSLFVMIFWMVTMVQIAWLEDANRALNHMVR